MSERTNPKPARIAVTHAQHLMVGDVIIIGNRPRKPPWWRIIKRWKWQRRPAAGGTYYVSRVSNRRGEIRVWPYRYSRRRLP